ncbi:hypothetical protein GCM10027174_26720 [Salinifilum aidingensis]
MFFTILTTFAEFEVDLLRARTKEGMAVATGKLRGKQPKLSTKQQRELVRMYSTGNDTSTISPSCSRSAGPPYTAPCSGMAAHDTFLMTSERPLSPADA